MSRVTKPVAHIGFSCKDLEKSLKFYKEILGLEEAYTIYYGDMIPKNPEYREKMPKERLERLESLKDVKWIVYLKWMDGVFIELFNEVDAYMENVPDSRLKFGYTHFAIVVDDVHAFYQEIIDKGAEDCVDIKPGPAMDRTINLWIHDPDGNPMEVQQYTEQSFQLVGKHD